MTAQEEREGDLIYIKTEAGSHTTYILPRRLKNKCLKHILSTGVRAVQK